jgi:hypothetical protein
MSATVTGRRLMCCLACRLQSVTSLAKKEPGAKTDFLFNATTHKINLSKKSRDIYLFLLLTGFTRHLNYIVTCSGTGDAVRYVTSFIYFTSRHYNFFLQFALITSTLILYLGWSSDCCLLGCCSNLTLRLWAVPLISFWRCVSLLSKSALLSKSSRTGRRTLCPRVVFCLLPSVG